MIVKICGITTIEDARVAADAGADWIGLNFWPRSPRYVPLDTARVIIEALDGRVRTVGIFVNATLETIEGAMADARLDFAQLHGEEPPELVHALGDRAIKAVRLRGATVIGRYAPALLLLDGDAPNVGGGGVPLDWMMAADPAARQRLILAGRLTPGNVAEAIRVVNPAGVDVASGVERAPGRKDVEKIRAFVATARAAAQEPR